MKDQRVQIEGDYCCTDKDDALKPQNIIFNLSWHHKTLLMRVYKVYRLRS